MTKLAIPKELEKVRQSAQRAVLPIRPANNETKAEKDFLFTAQRTDAGRGLPPYYLVYFLLVDLLGFKDLGRFEKLAWSVPIDFEGTAYLIEHRKFGVGVFARNAEAENENAKRIVNLIKKGVTIAQPYFRWTADNAVRASKFNVINKGRKLFERYKCLQGLYEAALAEEKARKHEHEILRKQREFPIHLRSVRDSQSLSPSELIPMFTSPWVRMSENANGEGVTSITISSGAFAKSKSVALRSFREL